MHQKFRWSYIYKFDHPENEILKQVEIINIGPDDDQVGVATFATTAKTEFYLDAHLNKSSLLQAVQNISFLHPGLSITSRGLKHVAENFYNSTRGDRSGVPNVLVLLTDGNPLHPQIAKAEAEALKNRGVEIFVLGTSANTDRQNLLDIATDSEHVMTFSDFGKLDNPSFVLELLHKLMSICTTM